MSKRSISIALIVNGFAAGWLLARSNFKWDCILAYIIIGITTVYLSNKTEN